MRGAGAVLLREIEERWQILLGSLFIGLAALIAPHMPNGIDRNMQGDFALMLGGIVSCITAAILGPAVIGRELAERRLSFFFSRPLSGAAIWSGKLAGVILLAGLCGAVAALPGGLIHALRRDPVPSSFSLSAFLSWGLLLILLLLCAHTVGILLRERSAWLLLDFVAFCVVLTGLFTVGSEARQAGAGEAFKQVWMPALILIALSLAGASAVQVIRGRTDLGRSRRVLSWTLWPLLLLVLLGMNGFSRWVLSPRLQDLLTIDQVMAAPAGGRVYVMGPVAGRPGYRPGFVLDARSGRFERIRQSARVGIPEPLVFSGEGRHLAFVRSPVDGPGWELATLDLSRSGARPQSLNLLSRNGGSPLLQLSRDGRLLAFLNQGRLVVRDLQGDRLVASAPVGDINEVSYLVALRFPDARHLRIVHSDVPARTGFNIRIQDLDLATGRLLPEKVLSSGGLFFSASPDGRRILARTDDDRFLALYDVDTQGMRSLAVTSMLAKSSRLAFLPDGRPAVPILYQGSVELWIHPADGSGRPERHVFPGSRGLIVGGQPSPGKLIVTTGPGLQTWLLDLQTDQRRKIGEGLVPLRTDFKVSTPEGAAAWLFRRGTRLIQIDPATGRERILTGSAREAR
ncbi:MAG TPA: hypothetical protein VHU81_08405 [Thermoanaerobaculia bacterium]|jgi:hypothetical protein|nr:hypothetical protein [Thermoanaerobaculia bacterium]